MSEACPNSRGVSEQTPHPVALNDNEQEQTVSIEQSEVFHLASAIAWVTVLISALLRYSSSDMTFCGRRNFRSNCAPQEARMKISASARSLLTSSNVHDSLFSSDSAAQFSAIPRKLVQW
ncbi:MAG: hypothetical protein KME36_15960 [Candidatus Thiodiazotropha sp. (ex Lucina pensylvanica)]|nr:hypothetical protein [Candidatus Thiodiazotropha sp. (ex Lucina pensylvanica)]MBT3052021.1 hypothetical protein [Candidatus Thiodiazotropha sp. (ex Codakia orbicularis)]